MSFKSIQTYIYNICEIFSERNRIYARKGQNMKIWSLMLVAIVVFWLFVYGGRCMSAVLLVPLVPLVVVTVLF